MDSSATAAQLLDGPRGRSLCLQVSGVDVFDVMSNTYLAKHPPKPTIGSDAVVWLSGPLLTTDTPAAVVHALAQQSPPPPDRLNTASLFETLAGVVSEASYWDPPSDDDLAAADPAVVAALRPVAEAVAAAPGAAWWSRPLTPNDQHYVSRLLSRRATRGRPPRLTGIKQRLIAARRRAQQPQTVWWSIPDQGDAVSTSPPFGGLPALQLALVEDPMGWERATVARLQPALGARVYEVTDADAWVRLVERYPLDVGASRSGAWHVVTGRRSRWWMPDWAAVADDYDAVHLTVLGYLAAAGRGLDAAGGTTVLAGWEPDVTYWLNDVLTQAEPPATWTDYDPAGSYTSWQRA